VDATTGHATGTLPPREPGDARGVSLYGLAFATEGSDDPNRSTLVCTLRGAPLWKATLDSLALGPVSVAGDKVFVTTTGRDKAKAFLDARRLVDGAPDWRRELDDLPVSFVVASAEWCAVATADEKVAVFRAADGKPREPLPVGPKPVAPALSGDVLVVAGENRIAAHDLASSEWIWNYKDQDNIGTATGQPVILNETIWVGTTKRGLVAIGIPPTQAKP